MIIGHILYIQPTILTVIRIITIIGMMIKITITINNVSDNPIARVGIKKYDVDHNIRSSKPNILHDHMFS